jgi:hypothetical protein
MTDPIQLQNAYRTLLEAAATVADSNETSPSMPDGEWGADQILAHVTLVNATTIAAVSAITSGINATYDNRIALDTWTIERIITLTGGNTGLRDRIRAQADALCALSGPILSEAELDTMVPSRLLSNDKVLVDQPIPLRDLITGLATVELPGHTKQLLDLLSESAKT